MEQMSPRDERNLVSAVEEAIEQTHLGLSPNAAVLKVASARQLQPEHIRRIGEAFNKSKSVHIFKTASEGDRAKPFDIVDSAWVIEQMYSPKEASVSSFQLPSGDFVGLDLNFGTLEKEAAEAPTPELSEQQTKLVDRLLKQAAIEHEQVCNGIRERIRMRVVQHKYAFDCALDNILQHMRSLPDSALQKIAQFIVNGYTSSGPGLLQILEYKLAREIPKVQKTANAVVFPTREPYLSLGKLYTAAEEMARAEVEMQYFEKKATEPFFSSIAANTVANILGGTGLNQKQLAEIASGSKKKSEPVEEALDPVFYNRLKSHDAKRAFMLMALYDPDLKQYKYPELVRAYNTTVSSVPEAFENQSVLKNLMLRNLQSSGVKDPFELAQEADLGKKLRERSEYSRKLQLEEADRLEEDKEKESPTLTSGVPTKSRALSALAELSKSLSEVTKSKPKPKPKPGKGGGTP